EFQRHTGLNNARIIGCAASTLPAPPCQQRSRRLPPSTNRAMELTSGSAAASISQARRRYTASKSCIRSWTFVRNQAASNVVTVSSLLPAERFEQKNFYSPQPYRQHGVD